jgi:hypothetical protein
VKTRALAIEMRTAFAALPSADAEMLVALGVSASTIDLWQLIGKSRIRLLPGELYEPHQSGKVAFLTPVLGHYADTPESPEPWAACRCGNIMDIVAWHPKWPERWCLRTGNASWLGSIPPQYVNPPPVSIRRSPLSWFQSGCEGLVILTRHRAEAYILLSNCRDDIVAEDPLHERDLHAILERPWPAPRLAPTAIRHAA